MGTGSIHLTWLDQQSKKNKAVVLQGEVLAVEQRVSGVDHPSTLIAAVGEPAAIRRPFTNLTASRALLVTVYVHHLTPHMHRNYLHCNGLA
jgi:hypothetical protein